MTGSENHGNRVYVGIDPNPDGCLHNGVYFTQDAQSDYQIELDRALSISMAAKLADTTIRIDYDQLGGVGTICNGYGIYIQ
jgi:hypothetical protein